MLVSYLHSQPKKCNRARLPGRTGITSFPRCNNGRFGFVLYDAKGGPKRVPKISFPVPFFSWRLLARGGRPAPRSACDPRHRCARRARRAQPPERQHALILRITGRFFSESTDSRRPPRCAFMPFSQAVPRDFLLRSRFAAFGVRYSAFVDIMRGHGKIRTP